MVHLPDISKDFLYRTVPVIFNGKSFLIYSPFSRQIIKTNKLDSLIIPNLLSQTFILAGRGCKPRPASSVQI